VSQKNEIKPWLRDEWCIPPKQSGEFVWRMEDVLDVYRRPYDARYPQVCIDEKPWQLVGDVPGRDPLPCRPGSAAKRDYEYKRNGTANVFVAFEPLAGWRHYEVTERRTAVDFARFVRGLLDGPYAGAAKLVVVMDNLNTHTPGSLFEAFPPDEAKRLADRLEIHPTPKHGSWLNMAEIDLSVLARQLPGRVPDKDALAAAAAARERDRNRRKSGADWRFTTADARVKLKRLYPAVS
jgi:hypothetical protein